MTPECTNDLRPTHKPPNLRIFRQVADLVDTQILEKVHLCGGGGSVRRDVTESDTKGPPAIKHNGEEGVRVLWWWRNNNEREACFFAEVIVSKNLTLDLTLVQ